MRASNMARQYHTSNASLKDERMLHDGSRRRRHAIRLRRVLMIKRMRPEIATNMAAPAAVMSKG